MVQMDFLEHPSVTDVIVMGVVMEEVRHRNSSVYQRLRALTLSATKRFFVFSNEHHRCSCTPHPCMLETPQGFKSTSSAFLAVRESSIPTDNCVQWLFWSSHHLVHPKALCGKQMKLIGAERLSSRRKVGSPSMTAMTVPYGLRQPGMQSAYQRCQCCWSRTMWRTCALPRQRA